MKKAVSTFVCLIFSSSLFSTAFADGVSQTAEKKFIVTAYYSPLPNQSFYLKGTYEWDLRLNGNGTHGASGKAVYPGMLAAPKSYPFGTKIYLEWVGLGTVDDRGGAIVEAGERNYAYDRIDIWMGQGEEGLKKALSWWKREVSGRIVTDGSDLAPIDHATFKASSVSLKAVSLAGGSSASEGFLDSPVSSASSKEYVEQVEKVLIDLGYYKGERDGKYDKGISEAIYTFQKDNSIVKNMKDYGAWYLGPKTRLHLASKHQAFQVEEKKREEIAMKEREEMVKKAEVWKKKREEMKILVDSFGMPKDGEVGPHVRKLQLTLKKLGYFEGKDTAIYGPKTKDAVKRLQIDMEEPAESADGKLDKDTKEKLVMRLLESNDIK